MGMIGYECDCLRCTKERHPIISFKGGFELPVEMTQMFVCERCGDKRCPAAEDHRNTCQYLCATASKGGLDK